MQSKANLIDAIRTHNPTAPVDWLATFTGDALRTYLDHLLSRLDPKNSAWVRPGDTSALTYRAAAA
ncbi:MAG: hypothetical protein QF561_01570 [Phycisphaerales bacterium]|jgi:hypothetical protein|nr:hypothetical protein [Phycisphaerales bacterium]